MMIQKRPKGEALEASPPANGRPAGGVQGGQRPPAQNYTTTTTVTDTVTVTIIITIIFYNLNKAGWPAGLYTKFRILNNLNNIINIIIIIIITVF